MIKCGITGHNGNLGKKFQKNLNSLNLMETSVKKDMLKIGSNIMILI